MSKQFLVYGLVDPRTNELRYIGASTQGLKRPARHMTTYMLRIQKTKTRSWIVSLKNLQLVPVITILRYCRTAKNTFRAERELIKHHRNLGANLTNHTDGGEGTWGRTHSQQTRDKISAANAKAHRGKRHSRKHVLKQAAATRGQRRTVTQRIAASRSRGYTAIQDQYGRRYPSRGEAARFLGIDASSVTRVIKKKQNHVRGFIFTEVV